MSFSKPARRAWTAAERQTLDKLLERGKTAPEIAAVLQRTPTSIYSQLQRLSIKKAGRLLVRFGLKAKK
jgi:IS30 family transposase